MENTTVVIDQILDLTNTINSLRNELSVSQREAGAQEETINILNKQIEEIKNKQPEVRIIKQVPKKNTWGDVYGIADEVIEYRNLSSIQDDIRKELESKYKKDLESNEKTIKDLNKKLEHNEENYISRYNNVVSEYSKYTQESRLEYDDKKLKLDKKLHDKDLEIQKIREELEKVKNDKTDEQVAKQREEEITKLKLRIKDLEKTVKEMMNMNFLKRFWNSITNKAVRVAAEKEVIEKQQEIDKIKGNKLGSVLLNMTYGRNTSTHDWIF